MRQTAIFRNALTCPEAFTTTDLFEDEALLHPGGLGSASPQEHLFRVVHPFPVIIMFTLKGVRVQDSYFHTAQEFN